jgi:hypothetical protein
MTIVCICCLIVKNLLLLLRLRFQSPDADSCNYDNESGLKMTVWRLKRVAALYE